MIKHERAIAEIVKNKFMAAHGSHDWEHTRRVVNLAKAIGVREGADMDVVVAGALLHDIGRCYQDSTNGSICHAQRSGYGRKHSEQVFFFRRPEK